MKSFVSFVIFIPGICWGTVFQTVPQTLSKVFPGAGQIEKRNAYLDKNQIRTINENLENKIDEQSTLITYYEYSENHKMIGYAYIDTGRVRKETETLMIVVNPDESIRDIEILQFSEPKEYAPSDPWKKQFEAKNFQDFKSGKSNIVGITGATLTSKAVTRAVQKVLAVHHYLHTLETKQRP